MSESSLPSSDPGTQKRRSTRIVQAVPITVSGVDALGQPFKERTTTVMVNCHGCKYQSKHYVPKNSVVTLEIPRMEPAFPPRVVPGHVVWVQRPRTVRELFQIGLEFETPGNVWGIAFPPEDWVPGADEQAPAAAQAESEIEVIVETAPPPAQPVSAANIAVTPEKRPPIPPPPTSKIPISPLPPPGELPTPAAPSATAPSAGADKIHVMPSPGAAAQDAQVVIARQMAKIVAEAKDTLDKTLRRGAQTAINEEMTIVRQQLDAQMHENIEHAVKTSLERVSEAEVKKVIQQAANKTAAIVEEARVASQTNVEQIDAKVRDAIKQAVGEAAAQTAAQNASAVEELRKTAQEAAAQAAEQAASKSAAITEQARQAAQDAATQAARNVVEQTVTGSLKHSVEDLVGRAMAEREAKNPSLQVLSSPEAAQQHLDEWKKNLEETASSVRTQMVTQSEAEAEAASRRWHEELEAMFSGTSQKLGERLNEISQASLASAERDMTERQSGLRALIDEVVSEGQAAISSLGNELAQTRAQTEEARSQLQQAALTTVENARRQMDDMVAAQKDAIARKAEEVIAERVQHIEPVLQNSAQKVLEHFSGELDQQLAPKLADAQRTASELAGANSQAAELQNSLRGQIEQASQRAEHIQNTIQQRVRDVSDSAVHKAVSDLNTVQQQTAELQERVRRGIQEAAEQAAQVQNTIQQRVQEVSDSAVHKAVSDLTSVQQQAAELQERVRQGIQEAAEQAAQVQNTIQQRVQEVSDSAVHKAVSDLTTVQQQTTELQERVRQGIQEAAEQAAQVQNTVQQRVQEVSDSAVHRAVSDLTAVQQQTAELQARLRQGIEESAAQAGRTQKEAIEHLQRASGDVVQKALADLGHARQQADQLNDDVRSQVQRAAEQAGQIQNSIQERIQAASDTAVKNAVAELAFAGQEAVRLQDSVREEIRQASDQASLLGDITLKQVRAASSDALQKVAAEAEAAKQYSAQLQNGIRDQVEKASLQVADFESKVRAQVQQAAQEAGEIQMLSREQVRQASEQAVADSIERMKQETTKFPTELEQTCRVTINKLEEELDQKSSEMQHSAYEALLKTSEWYQKKAQTSMQTNMERVLDQSSTAMRDKAGEVSSMVASELDHYRRTYVEHTRAEIEESSKETTDRERQKLNETAEIAQAAFNDRVQHVTVESLRRFQEASREAVEKARSDVEFNRECSLAEFQKVLDEKMLQGVEQANTYLQSQLMPMLESWEAKREAEKHEWMVHLKKSSEDSIDSYKAQLEAATKAWLLTSAATLGQNSQAVLETLTKTAEKRMRDTCSRVLAGMGDLLKDRLMGISSTLTTESDERSEDKD